MANMMTRRATAPPAVAATLMLAAACWAVAAWLMAGMDMGFATGPGTVGFFAAAWVTMMAAMMLPGASPAIARHTRTGGPPAGIRFAGTYLGVWALVGVAAYPVVRPHESLAAGVVVIAAGAYELTPLKRRFRRRCREDAGSAPGYALSCVGSSIGLMAMLLALDVMSPFWMAVVAVVITAQKLLPAKAAVDLPVALAIIALGVVIVFAPGQIPGLTPTTTMM